MIAKVLLFGIVLSAPNVIVKGNADMVKENYTINQPVTVYVEGDINASAAKQFAREMDRAYETGQPVIPIVIRSYGGSVYSLLSMIDTIKKSKVPVATIVVGKAMSAGAALLTCGTEGMRWMAPNATVMIHEVSSSTSGKTGTIKADADETLRLNELMLGIMSENIGKNRAYLKDTIHALGHADWFIDPAEAKKHNIVNHIGVPEFEITITVNAVLK